MMASSMGDLPVIKPFDPVAHYIDVRPAYYDFTPEQIDRCRQLSMAPMLIVIDPSRSKTLVRGSTHRSLKTKGYKLLGFIGGSNGAYSVTAWSDKI